MSDGGELLGGCFEGLVEMYFTVLGAASWPMRFVILTMTAGFLGCSGACCFGCLGGIDSTGDHAPPTPPPVLEAPAEPATP